MKLVKWALVCALWIPAGGVFAQDAAAGASSSEPTTYNFEDGDNVSGDLVRPTGEVLAVRRRSRRGSLIQIREHFVPEMLKSVEDL